MVLLSRKYENKRLVEIYFIYEIILYLFVNENETLYMHI